MVEGAEAESTGPRGVPERQGEFSDRQLIRRARGGSRDAVEALIERHWDRAHRIAYGVIGDAQAAEDVTQEAMLSVTANIGRFDPYRPFAPWLHTIVANRARDWARERARRAEVSVDPLQGRGQESVLREPDRATDPPARDPDLEVALASLSPDQRAAIVLRFVAGYGPKQIGQILGIPTGTVGSRLRRALDQLRAAMEEADG